MSDEHTPDPPASNEVTDGEPGTDELSTDGSGTGESATGAVVLQHASAAELVRSMTRAYRVDSTHIRTVLAHVKDDRGVLEALLDHAVLRSSIGIDVTREAWTVEAFVCELMGTSFHALTFSLRPNPEGPFPTTSVLTSFEARTALPVSVAGRERGRSATAQLAIYDTARRSTSAFDGTSLEEFLVEIPRGDGATTADGTVCFREVAAEVTGLTTEMRAPLSFVHAPVAAPNHAGLPRGVTGPCLRFGVAFPRFDDSRRLSFGTRLVSRCCDLGYGLWQRATTGGQDHDYWDPVVPPPPSPSGDAARIGDAVVVEGDDGRSGRSGRGGRWGRGRRRGRDGRPASVRPLAVSCVGPVQPGTTEAVLQVLERAGAPLLGLSETWLDDIAIIHLLTRTNLDERALGKLPVDLRADEVLSRALATGAPLCDDRLEDYRALMTQGWEVATDPGLAALWLGWVTPAVPDALGLTAKTLRVALDDTAARFVGVPGYEARPGHLNIGYVVCRQETGADRLHGGMRVALDLDALGVTRDPRGHDAKRPDDGGDVLDPRTGRCVSGTMLGRFCSDLERLWRTSLSFALGTAHVELDVVWRESWLGRWATLRSTRPDEDRW